MTKYLFIMLLYTIIILQCVFLGSTIIPSRPITIPFKEGFIVHLNTTKDFGKIKSCFFQFGDEPEIEIKLNSKEPHKRQSGELILPYSKTKCGIRVDNVSFAASNSWKLRAKNDNDESVSGVLSVVTVAAPKQNFEQIFRHELGPTEISCSTVNPTYCEIYDDTKLLSNTCKYNVVVRNKTSVKCNALKWHMISQIQEKIVIEPIERNLGSNTLGNYTETDEYVIMTCQFEKSVGHCKAEYPDEIKGAFINDGLKSGRFSTLDTSTIDGKCVLEIRKPLKSDEIGIWKITHLSNDRRSGCLFYVGGEKSKFIKKSVDRIKPMETIEIINRGYSTKRFSITCKAPFPIDLCYLIDPNNTIHFINNFMFYETNNLGYCVFDLDVLPGEYICGLRGEKFYENEIKYKYQVVVTNVKGEAVTSLIKTNKGDSIELLCRIPFNTVEHCIFLDPKRNSYYVSNFLKPKKSSRISYFGDGMEQGHCGIKVDNVQEDDIGEWTCHIKAPSMFQSSIFNIQVELNGLSQAATIGLATGLGGLVILFVISAIYYFKRKKDLATQRENSSNEQIQMTRRPSADSGASYTSKES